jgi:hypothetical protein
VVVEVLIAGLFYRVGRLRPSLEAGRKPHGIAGEPVKSFSVLTLTRFSPRAAG